MTTNIEDILKHILENYANQTGVTILRSEIEYFGITPRTGMVAGVEIVATRDVDVEVTEVNTFRVYVEDFGSDLDIQFTPFLIEEHQKTTGVSTQAIKVAMAKLPRFFIEQAVAPVFNPTPLAFESGQHVAMTSTTPGAKIYFTTNGDNPSVDSTLYTTPLTVTLNQTIKAIAVASGFSTSDVTSGDYVIPIG